MTFSLSPGQAHDASEGRELLKRLGSPDRPLNLIMDVRMKATRPANWPWTWATPVVPPKSTRLQLGVRPRHVQAPNEVETLVPAPQVRQLKREEPTDSVKLTELLALYAHLH